MAVNNFHTHGFEKDFFWKVCFVLCLVKVCSVSCLVHVANFGKSLADFINMLCGTYHKKQFIQHLEIFPKTVLRCYESVVKSPSCNI